MTHTKLDYIFALPPKFNLFTFQRVLQKLCKLAFDNEKVFLPSLLEFLHSRQYSSMLLNVQNLMNHETFYFEDVS